MMFHVKHPADFVVFHVKLSVPGRVIHAKVLYSPTFVPYIRSLELEGLALYLLLHNFLKIK